MLYEEERGLTLHPKLIYKIYKKGLPDALSRASC